MNRSTRPADVGRHRKPAPGTRVLNAALFAAAAAAAAVAAIALLAACAPAAAQADTAGEGGTNAGPGSGGFEPGRTDPGGSETGLEPVDPNHEIAAFGMGCFWGAEALFGGVAGVRRTSVGFAGGASQAPTYRSIGDHIETVLVEFDPQIVSYQALLEVFWSGHDPSRNPWMNQYRSMIFPVDSGQKRRAERAVSEARASRDGAVLTEVRPIEVFHPDRTYHSKYYLRNIKPLWTRVIQAFGSKQSALDSTVAARLNAWAGGKAEGEDALAAIEESNLSPQAAASLRAALPEGGEEQDADK